jgi:hypothetical protein
VRSLTYFLVFALLVFPARDTFAGASLSAKENEALCDRFGENMARKLAANPKQLAQELDELIVKVGSLGPDRVSHDRSGRKLASLSETPRSQEARWAGTEKGAALLVGAHRKLSEAGRLTAQMKRQGFFDEDEERASGVQEACASVISDRALILRRVIRER